MKIKKLKLIYHHHKNLNDNLQVSDMETEQQMSLQALLHELKDIKHTILNLDDEDRQRISVYCCRIQRNKQININTKKNKPDSTHWKGRIKGYKIKIANSKMRYYMHKEKCSMA